MLGQGSPNTLEDTSRLQRLLEVLEHLEVTSLSVLGWIHLVDQRLLCSASSVGSLHISLESLP